MILVDTSALYSLADPDEQNHQLAQPLFNRASDTRESLLHLYVIEETAALIQNRLGLDAALRFLRDIETFEIHWVGTEDHERAVGYLARAGRRRLSLVDCMSFVVMRERNIAQALAFDRHFVDKGFRLYG